MLRSILAVVAGVLVAAALVFAAEAAGHRLYPTPAIGAVDCGSKAAYAEKASAAVCVAATPAGAKLAVVAGWLLGAFGGGVAAALIGRKWAPLPLLVAATILLLCIVNFFAFPHPLWMIALAVLAAPLGGFGAVAATGARFGPPPPAAKSP